MVRVITRNGLGEISPIEFNRGLDARIRVDMEKKDPLGWRQVFIRRDIYEFGEHMVARVVNVGVIGRHSKILPFGQEIGAYRVYHNVVLNGNEIRFLLNLVTGQLEVNDRFGLPTDRFLCLQLWMDRWNVEPNVAHSSYDDSPDTVISKFDKWEQGCAGVDGGIFAPVLLDMEEMKIRVK